VKCRLLYLHKETNPGKIEILEALHKEYVAYVRVCIERMLAARAYTMPKGAKQAFFTKAENLSSQIEKNARDHAIGLVSTLPNLLHSRDALEALSPDSSSVGL
jgi:hypothetical protein